MSSMQEVRSFKVVQEMVIEGKPEKVFDALINDVSAWWGSPMYCTDNPSDFVFESKPGGAFYEITPDGDFAVWGRVTRYKKNHFIEYEGAVGMADAVHGRVCIEIEPKGTGCLLKLTHSAIGQISEETIKSYDAGWKDLLDRRLRAFVEAGSLLGLRGEKTS